MTPVIEVAHLHKRYGAFVAVEDVSFTVHEGEIFGILGPNGAGKTTTVECLQGLRRADGGEMHVLGHDPQREAEVVRRLIGSQLQESALPDRIKVWEALDLFSSLKPEGPSWDMVLDTWGLSDKRNAAFGGLSGGQQQRLFIALAVVNDPRVVFLDEMTAGLDPMARRATWELIRQIRDRGTTVVLVTHFMDEAQALCDRLAVIDRKRVVASGTPEDLIQTYAGGSRVMFSTDVADVDFLDDVPGVEAVSRSGRGVTVSGAGPLLALVAAALVERDIVPSDLAVQQSTLEDVFLAITRPEV